MQKYCGFVYLRLEERERGFISYADDFLGAAGGPRECDLRCRGTSPLLERAAAFGGHESEDPGSTGFFLVSPEP